MISLQSITRTAFLFFIIALSVYFIYVNKNHHSTESFVQKTDLQDKIINLYKSIYNVSPSDEMVKFYTDYFNNSNLNDQQLKDVIAVTTPVLENSSSNIDNEELYGTEDEVIVTFNQI